MKLFDSLTRKQMFKIQSVKNLCYIIDLEVETRRISQASITLTKTHFHEFTCCYLTKC